MFLWILVFLAAVLLGWLVATYNGFIAIKNRVEEAWSDIDVQLKRRHDLIPNLVDTVKGIAEQEKEVFTRVTEARSKALSGETPKEQAEAENMLTGALKSLFAVAEDYPEIKSDRNFLELQKELADTENKIMSARRFYNTLVRDYNIKRESFPSNLIAQAFGFKEQELFELEDTAARENVDIDFGSEEEGSEEPTEQSESDDQGEESEE